MKVNIFKIEKDKFGDLKDKIRSLAMKEEYTITKNGWNCKFYLSTKNEIDNISWKTDYGAVIPTLNKIKNNIHYSMYVCKKDNNIFVLTYGKSHFYVRKFSEPEFGLDIAKRIANEKDVKQKATKRYAGKVKKEVRSNFNNTELDNESGESVDYINAGIIDLKKEVFGNKGKFGNSFIISPDDLYVTNLTDLLDQVIFELTQPELFKIPKTTTVKDIRKIVEYNKILLDDILKNKDSLSTTTDSYDIVGVDFIFEPQQKYKFKLNGKMSSEFAELTYKDLVDFIKGYSINDAEILNINVEIINDGNAHTRRFIEMIEYCVEGKNVILENGEWKKFNEEYLKQINGFVDNIEIETTENCFTNISTSEPDFNDDKINDDLKKLGYLKADKEFARISLKGHIVEECDLIKDDTLYAVKFGTAQKLSYCCLQAINVLEILRNNANNGKKTNIKKYCLWFAFTNKKKINNLSDINSIMLKQQVDVFAKKCRELGIVPVLKFSKKINNIK